MSSVTRHRHDLAATPDGPRPSHHEAVRLEPSEDPSRAPPTQTARNVGHPIAQMDDALNVAWPELAAVHDHVSGALLKPLAEANEPAG